MNEIKFEASSGWFERFKKRNNLRSYKVCGESANVDQAEINNFVASLKSIIAEGGYTKKQLFNVDEGGSFFKMLFNYTYAPKGMRIRGMKEDKQRVTILFGNYTLTKMNYDLNVLF